MKPAASSKQPPSEGLDPLDQARAASLADEGGASAAALETQESPLAERSKPGALALFCAAAASVGLLALACRHRS